MGNDLVRLGPPLQYLISKIAINLHCPLNSNIIINLIDYFPHLKKGLCYDPVFHRLKNIYFKIRKDITPYDSKQLKEAFGNILMSNNNPIDTYQHYASIDPSFDPDSYGMSIIEVLMKYNIQFIPYGEYPDELDPIRNEVWLSEQLISVMERLNYPEPISLVDFVSLVQELNFENFQDLLLEDSRIKLSVAIIMSDESLVRKFLLEIDSRDNYYNAYFIALHMRDRKPASEILNIVKYNILIRNWHEKQVLIQALDPIIGTSEVSVDLLSYMRKLL